MTILDEAARLTSEDRRKEYGHPNESFHRIAKFWSVVLGIDVTPDQVALCMITVKIAREMNGHKPDSLIDIAGYARTIEMMHEEAKPVRMSTPERLHAWEDGH